MRPIRAFDKKTLGISAKLPFRITAQTRFDRWFEKVGSAPAPTGRRSAGPLPAGKYFLGHTFVRYHERILDRRCEMLNALRFRR